jgi:ribosome-binding factor A
MSDRAEKVGKQIQKDIADIVTKEGIGNGLRAMLTVTKTRVTNDLSIARVYISVFPSEKAEDYLTELNLKKSHIRLLLGNRVRNQLRIVPELHFYIDDSLDYIENIESLVK